MFCKSSYSQLTADFPDSNYSWNESSYTRGCDNGCPFNYVNGTIFDSTTHFFNNLRYRSIYFKGSSYTQIVSVFPHITTNIINYTKPLGYIRTDKQNKKVYFKEELNNSSTDLLLYDFDLELYETYPVTMQNSVTSTNNVVYRIDSIIDYKKIKRKIFYIGDSSETNYNFGGILIEGIGTSKGLFTNSINLQEGWASYNTVTCLKYNNVSYSYNWGSVSVFLDSVNSCNKHQYMFTSLDDDKYNSINIFPNPSNDFIVLENSENISNINIINCLGQTQILRYDYNNEKIIIDVKALTNGVYTLKARTNNFVYINKFVVKH